MKIAEITTELNRLNDVLSEAAETGKLLVLDRESAKYNPFPIFFTAINLVEEINKGNWHCGFWRLVERDEIKKAIMKRINELQERLMLL